MAKQYKYIRVELHTHKKLVKLKKQTKNKLPIGSIIDLLIDRDELINI